MSYSLHMLPLVASDEMRVRASLSPCRHPATIRNTSTSAGFACGSFKSSVRMRPGCSTTYSTSATPGRFSRPTGRWCEPFGTTASSRTLSSVSSGGEAGSSAADAEGDADGSAVGKPSDEEGVCAGDAGVASGACDEAEGAGDDDPPDVLQPLKTTAQKNKNSNFRKEDLMAPPRFRFHLLNILPP